MRCVFSAPVNQPDTHINDVFQVIFTIVAKCLSSRNTEVSFILITNFLQGRNSIFQSVVILNNYIYINNRFCRQPCTEVLPTCSMLIASCPRASVSSFCILRKSSLQCSSNGSTTICFVIILRSLVGLPVVASSIPHQIQL